MRRNLDIELEIAVSSFEAQRNSASIGRELGLRDAIVEHDGDMAGSVDLLRQFTRYLFTESPAVRAGQTFRVAADAPVYRLLDDPGSGYEEGSLYANSNSFWRLVRAD